MHIGRSRRAAPGVRDIERGAALEERAAALLEARRGRKIAQPPPTAARHAAPILTPILQKSGVGLGELRRNWPEIVGEKLAKATEPDKLSAGILTIKAPGAVAPFVQHQATLILERCKLAGAKVKSIAIRQGAPAPATAANVRTLRPALSAAEEAQIEAGLAAIETPRLKAALSRLGRAVRRG